MAVAYSVLGYLSEEKRCLQKALELSSRVSDRERYLIEAEFYRSSEKTYDKAIEAYKKLLELYPDDTTGNVNLGYLFNDIEEWDKAIERFDVLIKAKDVKFYPYFHIANSYMGKGLFNKAREVLGYYLSNFADNTWIHRALAGSYVLQGEYDLALTEIEKAQRHYLNAIESLAVLAKQNEKNIEPELAAMYNEKLQLLDESIDDCRRLLEENELNKKAIDFMFASYQKKVDTLREMINYKKNKGTVL